jgi:hypothetical protein
LSVWSILSVLVFAGGFFVAVSEREELGPRVARKIPSSGLRLPAFFLFSGGASGVVWAAWMSVATWLAVSFVTASSATIRTGNSTKGSQVWVEGLALYAFAYSMSGLLIRRHLLSRWIGSKYTWLIALLLLAAGCIIPFLIGYLMAFGNFQRAEDIGGWLVTNPFMLGVKSYQTTYLVFAGGWSLLAGLLNLDWFIEQIKSFRRPEPVAPAVGLEVT